MRTAALLVLAALAELLGCYLPYLYFNRHQSMWLLLPGAASLAMFAWLLNLVPSVPGRTYAIYGVVYVTMSLLWLWIIDRETPRATELIGAAIAISGMAMMAVMGAVDRVDAE